MIWRARGTRKPRIPNKMPPATPSGTAMAIEASVVMALAHWPNTARYRKAAPASSARRVPPKRQPSAAAMPTTAIHGSGGASCTAVDPLPRRSPVENIAVAAVSGTSRTALNARVACLKVNRPKLASSTNHFMKLEIAVSNPSRHWGGISSIQPGSVPAGSAKAVTDSTARIIQIPSAAGTLPLPARLLSAKAAVMVPPWRR